MLTTKNVLSQSHQGGGTIHTKAGLTWAPIHKYIKMHSPQRCSINTSYSLPSQQRFQGGRQCLLMSTLQKRKLLPKGCWTESEDTQPVSDNAGDNAVFCVPPVSTDRAVTESYTDTVPFTVGNRKRKKRICIRKYVFLKKE